MLSFNKEVAINRINEHFETESFNFFKKHTPIHPDVQSSDGYECLSDAFAIELYSLQSDVDDRLSYNLLEAAFETYSDLSYCLISVPNEDKHFPLLQYFVV